MNSMTSAVTYHITSVGVGESSWGDCKWKRGRKPMIMTKLHRWGEMSLPSKHESDCSASVSHDVHREDMCDGVRWIKRNLPCKRLGLKECDFTGKELMRLLREKPACHWWKTFTDFTVRMRDGDGRTAEWKMKRERLQREVSATRSKLLIYAGK